MTRCVVHADDLLADEDRVRHDDAALKHRRERLRDRRLAGAGWSEEEDRLRAVDRGSELAEREVRQHEMRERFAKTLERDLDRTDRLRAHARDVGVERNRCRADVAVARHRFLGADLALLGDHVDVGGRGHAGAALHLDEVLGLTEVEDGLEDLERQAQDLCELRSGRRPLVQELEREVGDERRREAGLFDRRRCERRGSLGRARRSHRGRGCCCCRYCGCHVLPILRKRWSGEFRGAGFPLREGNGLQSRVTTSEDTETPLTARATRRGTEAPARGGPGPQESARGSRVPL